MKKTLKHIFGTILLVTLIAGLRCAVMAAPTAVNNYADLEYQLNQGADEITITQSFSFNGNIEIAEGRNIIISGAGLTLTQTVSEERHFVIASGASLVLHNLTLDGSDSGGGIEVDNNGSLELQDKVAIKNCYAENGGAIYTYNTGYSNITTSPDTILSGNKALKAYIPPANAPSLYPNIKFASASLLEHPLNNCDINYTGGKIFTYTVTYNENIPNTINSKTYSEPVDYIDSFTYELLYSNDPNLKFTRGGYGFNGWNTQRDGTGTSYAAGEEIALSDDLELYAQWQASGSGGSSGRGTSTYNTSFTNGSSSGSGSGRNDYSTNPGFLSNSTNDTILSVILDPVQGFDTDKAEASPEQPGQSLDASAAGQKANPATNAFNILMLPALLLMCVGMFIYKLRLLSPYK